MSDAQGGAAFVLSVLMYGISIGLAVYAFPVALEYARAAMNVPGLLLADRWLLAGIAVVAIASIIGFVVAGRFGGV